MRDDGYFDENLAATYDDDTATSAPEIVSRTVDVLAELAGDGSALEFAIGTGRLALPLARRGVTVQGIELSAAMVACLREKKGSGDIKVTIGDMAKTQMTDRFSLVYLVFNTINNLTTQDAQVACFQNASAHLEPGGCFLIEVAVPPLQRLPRGEKLLAFERTAAHWGVDEYDVATQNFTSHHVRIRGNACEQVSIPFRYVWPSELDLMARLAGLTLKERWSNWQRDPFTSTSDNHISIWQKPAKKQ